MKKGPRDWTNLSDEACETFPDGLVCKTHNQSIMTCANQRLTQIKEAREMAERRLRWAHVWKEWANRTRREIHAIRRRETAVQDPARGEA